MAAVNNQEMDYAIKPEAVKPTVSSEDWPLLLKNYEKCTFFSSRISGSWLTASLRSARSNRSLHTNPCWCLAPEA